MTTQQQTQLEQLGAEITALELSISSKENYNEYQHTLNSFKKD